MQTQKHKIDKKLLSFLPILLTLLLPLFLSYATTTYISDTFEANPWTGDQFWTSINDVGTTAAAKYAGTYSLAVNESLPVSGRVTFEFGETIPENLTYTAYARSTDTATSGIEIKLKTNNDNCYYVGNINHTKDFELEPTAEAFWLITKYDNSSITGTIYNTTLPVVTTRWTKLEIRYDNSTNRVNCYINGTYLRAYTETGELTEINARFDEWGTTAYLDDINVESNPPPTNYGSPLATLGMWLIPGFAVLAMVILLWKLKDAEGSIVHKTMVIGISLLLIAILVPIALNLLG